MTGLFDFVWPDRAIALREISSLVTVRTQPNGNSRELRMNDGKTYGLTVNDAQRLMRRPVQMIPAEPGLAVVRVWMDEGVGEVIRTPLIAWALCFDGEVRAVTPQGVEEDEHHIIYVAMSDGSVQSVGDWGDQVWFDSIDEFRLAEVERLSALREAAE